MLLKALDGYRRIYGSEHRTTSNVRYDLGYLYTEWFMFEKAVQQFEIALESYKNLLGPYHEKTISCLRLLKVCQRESEADKKTSKSTSKGCDRVSGSRRLSAS